jgi:hypothetical protein
MWMFLFFMEIGGRAETKTPSSHMQRRKMEQDRILIVRR